MFGHVPVTGGQDVANGVQVPKDSDQVQTRLDSGGLYTTGKIDVENGEWLRKECFGRNY